MSLEAAVAHVDAELVRLDGQARRAADVFDRQLARVKIDELLELRYKLTMGVRDPLDREADRLAKEPIG